jgi:hypothetical protein
MANYPKTRTTRKIVKMSHGKWEQITDIPSLPDTTRYIRWYGDARIVLFHKKGDDKYTLVRVEGDEWDVKKFRAKSLQRAQDRANLMNETWEM